MTGVLLVNMGGPNSLEEMKIFLSNMFKDPHILPFYKPLRYLLGYIISKTRYKKSWKKYELIGGTPIIRATERTVTNLSKKLNSHYNIKMAFSYSTPFIEESLVSFKNEGIKNITVIPLYPQSSHSTTSSVLADVNKTVSRYKELNIKFVHDFYKHDKFITFWSEIISEHILENQYRHPFLLFSAHSIPQYLVNKGDTYAISIEESAKLIARNIGVEYNFSYQSGMSRGKWLKPDTKQRLKELAVKGVSEIILIPISFVNENLETLYDLDHDIIPYAKNELGISSVSRVKIPEVHDMFIGLLADLVKTNL
jgi:protoporphyrin/coproporphyrin ferrochelatase